jgi:hypothetical protein
VVLVIFKIKEIAMSKMSKKRKRRKLSKLLKSVQKIKKRLPIAPPRLVFKSKKDYNRQENKKIARDSLD